jgi:general L-amino acid transport system permease protein
MSDITSPGPHGPGFSIKLRSWIGPLALQQLCLLLGVMAIFWFFQSNALAAMARLGLTPGFGFLSHSANFEIGESLIAYAAGDTYGRAIIAGLLNTVHVAVLGCLLATALGTVLGIARLSGNALLSRLVQTYVDVLRGTPLLLQLFLWSTVLQSLPGPKQAPSLFNAAFLSNRGVFIPSIGFEGISTVFWFPAFVLLIAAAVFVSRKVFRGTAFYISKTLAVTACVIIVTAVLLHLTGFPLVADIPQRGGFNIRGGASLSPEFAALLIGLVFNASAIISEIVRSGIQSVKSGQWEAARALGLKPGQIMRLVVLPQALRVITPLMTSSYLDLTKNSSLAVAIGFPDIVSVANTTANTTGQVLEAIAIIVVVYLSLNLTVSALMNVYNRKVALKGAAQR